MFLLVKDLINSLRLVKHLYLAKDLYFAKYPYLVKDLQFVDDRYSVQTFKLDAAISPVFQSPNETDSMRLFGMRVKDAILVLKEF